MSNIPDIWYMLAYSRSIRLLERIANVISHFASSYWQIWSPPHLLADIQKGTARFLFDLSTCLLSRWCRQTDRQPDARSSTRLVLCCSGEVADKPISTPNDQLPLLCNRHYAGHNLWAATSVTTQVTECSGGGGSIQSRPGPSP